MKIKGDGVKLRLKEGVKVDIGRGTGSDPTDRTVSRRHVCFQLLTSRHEDKIRARFQVIGLNPIWVQYNTTGKIKMYRSLEIGEMESGDKFCVSAKKPIWLTLKRLELGAEIRESGLETELEKSSQIEELDVDSIDISALDPVKEFGFVVMGHELDCYPKSMIHNIKKWDWFIEEHGQESDNDEISGRKGKGGRRRKRKKNGGDENDDDDWTDEDEEIKEVLANSSKVNRPKYLTRSKGSDRPVKVAKSGGNSPQIKNEEVDVEEEEGDDEDDETLGGFIVDEDSAGEKPENDEEDDEEEEFDAEDDEEE